MAQITVEKYAKKRGVSKVAVTRAAKAGKVLINILSYKKLGRDWFLTESPSPKKIKKGKCIVI